MLYAADKFIRFIVYLSDFGINIYLISILIHPKLFPLGYNKIQNFPTRLQPLSILTAYPIANS